jgi:hypothetical protein
MFCEYKMQFFTPELYRRYNAPALAADAEWETAISRYRRHLETLQAKMPSPVIELSQLCLHDGEMLQRQEQQHPLGWYFDNWPGPSPFWPFWYGIATLAVRLENEVVTLFYFLSDHMTEQPAADDWPFSREREHWLYDEIHSQGRDWGRFTHLILLSSGVLLTIPFATVSISRFPLSPVSSESGKQSA